MRHWGERAAGACFVVVGGLIMTDAHSLILN
mgnify:CR=1 FL=1